MSTLHRECVYVVVCIGNTLFLTIGSICPNSQDIELTGTNLICPEQVGFFQCTVQNGFILRWNIDDESGTFIATDLVGGMITLSSDSSITTAYLVERIVLDESFPVGNRTSILSHKINPNFTGNFVIICNGGNGDSVCNQTVSVVGGKL